MIALLTVLALHADVDERALQVIDRYAAVYDKMKTLSFTVKKIERMRDGVVTTEETKVKLRRPQDVYIAATLPRVGQEVLYVPKIDRRKLRVHPGSFPDLTLMLEIHGDLVMNKQHHPVYHMDPGYTLSLLKKGVKEAREGSTGGKAVYIGEGTKNGRPVVTIELQAGNRPTKKVAAKAGERLIDFALRNDNDPYVVFVANPQVASITSKLNEGAEYNLPAYYAERCEFSFDKEQGTVVEQTIYNGNVMYERLSYRDVVLDPPLTDLDFDYKNPAYKF